MVVPEAVAAAIVALFAVVVPRFGRALWVTQRLHSPQVQAAGPGTVAEGL